MQNIVIDKEFKELLPALDAETFRLLEENLLQNGCRDSLVLWGDTLIDGHNRYAICTEHGIPFNTITKEFGSREEALIWIISTQVSRRNLTPVQLTNYRGLHYMADRRIVTNQDGKNQYSQAVEVDGQNVHQPQQQSTAGRLARQYRVNEKTIRRDAKIAEAIAAIGAESPEAKRMILASEVKMTKKELEALATMTAGELNDIALQIEGGTYTENKENPPDMANAVLPGSSGTSLPAKPGKRLSKATIRKIADAFFSQLRELTNGGQAELKQALKACIAVFEELHDQT